MFLFGLCFVLYLLCLINGIWRCDYPNDDKLIFFLDLLMNEDALEKITQIVEELKDYQVGKTYLLFFY